MEDKHLKEKYEEFHKKAGIQTKIINSKNFTYHIVLSFIDKYLQPEMKVLDIGCGVGTLSLYVASKGNEVRGIDISEKAIDAAKKSIETLRIKNASFIAIDFLDADFQEKFDFIIFSEVMEHLPDDKLAIKKIHELMKDNAILFLTVPSKNAPIHRIRKLIFGQDIFDQKVGHLRRYSKSEVVGLLKSHEFEVIEVALTEGGLRNFLFTTSIGNKFLMLANVPIVKKFVTLVDSVCIKIFGESQIITVSKKKE